MRWLSLKWLAPQGGGEPAAGRCPAAEEEPLLREVARHAEALLAPVFTERFDDEVFLAGGAFKPVLNPGHPVRDLDLWVRDRKVRERLRAHLVERCGAEVVHDFHPYCIKFRAAGGEELEVTYQNVKDRPIADVLYGFDLAPVSIAACYRGGEVTSAVVTEEARRAIERREALFNRTYLEKLEAARNPDVLQALDRLTRLSEELGYAVPEDEVERLWEIYEGIYDRGEQQACVDTYLKTTVDYKGRCDLRLLQRASAAEVLGS